MAIGFTCSWRPGTLRPYESIGSFGAKYCYLNKITFSQFGKTIAEFLSADATGHYDIDFGKGLSRLLGEPPALVDTLSLKKFRLGPHSQALCSSWHISEFNFEEFKYCPVCLADGYHSNLHQLVFLDKCFIHKCSLEKFPVFHQSLSHFGRETRLIKPLYDKWFKSDYLHFKGEEIWPEAKFPVWKLNSKKPIHASANRVLSSFKLLEKRVAVMPHHPSGLFGDSIVAKVKMSTNMVGLRTSVFNSLNDLRLNFKKARHFVCNAEEAIAILELDGHDFSQLMHKRQVACTISGAWPPWRLTLERLKQHLVSGHENCLKLVYDGSLLTHVIQASYSKHYLLAPFNRELFYRVPCDRIVTLNFLQSLLDIETGNPFSHMQLSEFSIFVDHRNVLKSPGLMGEIVGFIPRDGHKLFGDNNHFLEFSDLGEKTMRSCYLIVPLGVLANILDEVILAHVWSWCWALFSMEQQARKLDDLPHTYPEHILEDEIDRLKPLFTFEQDTSGLIMKTGTFVPYKMPPWKTCLGNKRKHTNEVADASNLMIEQFKDLEQAVEAKIFDSMPVLHLYQK